METRERDIRQMVLCISCTLLSTQRSSNTHYLFTTTEITFGSSSSSMLFIGPQSPPFVVPMLASFSPLLLFLGKRHVIKHFFSSRPTLCMCASILRLFGSSQQCCVFIEGERRGASHMIIRQEAWQKGVRCIHRQRGGWDELGLQSPTLDPEILGSPLIWPTPPRSSTPPPLKIFVIDPAFGHFYP